MSSKDNFKKRTKNKRFSHIKPLIQNLVKPINFDNDIFKEICFLWKNLYEINGQINKNSKPLFLKNKILMVSVTNSSFIQEFQFIKDEIISSLNNSLGQQIIIDIKFRLGNG